MSSTWKQCFCKRLRERKKLFETIHQSCIEVHDWISWISWRIIHEDPKREKLHEKLPQVALSEDFLWQNHNWTRNFMVHHHFFIIFPRFPLCFPHSNSHLGASHVDPTLPPPWRSSLRRPWAGLSKMLSKIFHIKHHMNMIYVWLEDEYRQC